MLVAIFFSILLDDFPWFVEVFLARVSGEIAVFFRLMLEIFLEISEKDVLFEKPSLKLSFLGF
jgi:hypothetical protein